MSSVAGLHSGKCDGDKVGKHFPIHWLMEVDMSEKDSHWMAACLRDGVLKVRKENLPNVANSLYHNFEMKNRVRK